MKNQLREIRLARGWTQDQLINAVQAATERLGYKPKSRASLKTQISAFENNRRVPGAEFRALFREVYRVTNVELGFPPEPRPEPQQASPPLLLPAPVARNASTVVPGMVAYLQSTFVLHAEAEPMFGPRLIITPVQAQMGMIEQLCQDARGPIRDDALRTGARYSEFLGWLYQDSGDTATAMKWTNQALDYAQELDDVVVSSYIQQRRSNIATESGRPGNGLGFANAALRRSRDLPPSVQAVALRQVANSYALLHEGAECARALEQARELAAAVDRTDPTDIAGYCSLAYVEMEAANCAVLLRRPDDAVSTLQASLRHWPDGQQRDQGLCFARLATASALLEDVESAAEFGQAALDIALATGSARVLQELYRLETHLAPWRKLVEIAKLSKTLSELRGTGA
jgi:transcriptional regulator with XRE-family HTH domain